MTQLLRTLTLNVQTTTNLLLLLLVALFKLCVTSLYCVTQPLRVSLNSQTPKTPLIYLLFKLCVTSLY